MLDLTTECVHEGNISKGHNLHYSGDNSQCVFACTGSRQNNRNINNAPLQRSFRSTCAAAAAAEQSLQGNRMLELTLRRKGSRSRKQV